MASVDELNDRTIATDIADLLANDRRLQALDVSFQVRGGVVHVSGRVPSVAAWERGRQVLSRLRGVKAIWDVVAVNGQPRPRVLDLGCGSKKQHQAAIGVDHALAASVDVLADLEEGLPFRSSTIDHVFAIHVLEHVHNLLGLMNEIHRALKASGILHVMVPHWTHVNASADPTHVRYFNVQTFKYFCQPHPGVQLFEPLLVTATEDTIIADLRPLKGSAPPPSDELLARFFR